MNFCIAIVYVLWFLLIGTNRNQHVNGVELHPPEKERCPDGHHPECQTDEDCVNRISDGSLHGNCSKCVCWHVPNCDVKR